MEDAPERAALTDDGRVLPLEAHGLPLVSFGFFLGEASPAVWRGPLVAKAVDQLSRGVVWPDLDVLVVDLPPGTGEVAGAWPGTSAWGCWHGSRSIPRYARGGAGVLRPWRKRPARGRRVPRLDPRSSA